MLIPPKKPIPQSRKPILGVEAPWTSHDVGGSAVDAMYSMVRTKRFGPPIHGPVGTSQQPVCEFPELPIFMLGGRMSATHVTPGGTVALMESREKSNVLVRITYATREVPLSEESRWQLVAAG